MNQIQLTKFINKLLNKQASGELDVKDVDHKPNLLDSLFVLLNNLAPWVIIASPFVLVLFFSGWLLTWNTSINQLSNYINHVKYNPVPHQICNYYMLATVIICVLFIILFVLSEWYLSKNGVRFEITKKNLNSYLTTNGLSEIANNAYDDPNYSFYLYLFYAFLINKKSQALAIISHSNLIKLHNKLNTLTALNGALSNKYDILSSQYQTELNHVNQDLETLIKPEIVNTIKTISESNNNNLKTLLPDNVKQQLISEMPINDYFSKN